MSACYPVTDLSEYIVAESLTGGQKFLSLSLSPNTFLVCITSYLFCSLETVNFIYFLPVDFYFATSFGQDRLPLLVPVAKQEVITFALSIFRYYIIFKLREVLKTSDI